MYISKRGDFLEINSEDEDYTKEEDGIMAVVAKPSTRAFMLKSDMVEQFVKKNVASKKALERFHAHKPKGNVNTPLKKSH